MLRVTVFALLLFVVPACVHTPAVPSTVQAPAPVPPALLWRAEKSGRISWLFGTIHAGVDAHNDLPAHVWQLMRAAPCFIMETDPSQIDGKELFAMSRLARGRSLAKELSQSAWMKLSRKLTAVLPEPALMGSQPWFAAMLYLQTVVPPGAAMDGVFLAEAKSLQKRLGFLEDWREAVTAFAGAVDAQDLEELVTSEERVKQQTGDLLAAYRLADHEALRKVIAGSMQGHTQAEAKMNRMLAGRNQVWISRLDQEIAAGGCFVAVGAGHLVGESNLISLLQQRGYRVSRGPSVEGTLQQ